MTDPNLDVLSKVYDAMAAGDFSTVMDMLADDVTGHVPGTSPVAGEYVGKAEVGRYVGLLAELSGGTLRFEPDAVVVTGEHGVGLVKDLGLLANASRQR